MSDSLEITKAVKEALTDKRLEDLAVQITNLSTQMTAGFAGSHTRQDQTNGKVLKNTQDIANLQSTSLYEKLLWALITALIGVVTFFLTKK